MILQEHPAEPPDLCSPSLDKLDIPAFTSDLQKWKTWLTPQATEEWGKFIKDGIHKFSDPNYCNHPWMLTELADTMRADIPPVQDEEQDTPDLLQMEIDTPEVRMYAYMTQSSVFINEILYYTTLTIISYQLIKGTHYY